MITIHCSFCGQPVEVPDSLAQWGVQCDDCRKRDDSQANSQSRKDLQQERWCKVCPPQFLNTDPALLPAQQKTDEAMRWPFYEQPNGFGLILWGWTRTGKTRTMWLILKREHFRGRSIVAFGPGEFALECEKRNYRRARWIQRLSTVDILALDDFDKYKMTRTIEQALFAVVDRRSAAKRPVFYTCNTSGDQLETLFHCGAPLVARMREFCFAVHFPKPEREVEYATVVK